MNPSLSLSLRSTSLLLYAYQMHLHKTNTVPTLCSYAKSRGVDSVHKKKAVTREGVQTEMSGRVALSIHLVTLKCKFSIPRVVFENLAYALFHLVHWLFPEAMTP